MTEFHHIGSILKVLVYIEEHLDEELTLDRMAKIAHISPYHFHRVFRAYMGETLGEHVKKLRMRKAEKRLHHSDVPITELALSLGYETPSSFTKVFNQVMGMSPRAYRKIMQARVQKIQSVRTPEYIERKDETVLFVRRIGDYNETPWQAFDALLKEIPEEKIKSYYSVALDDPDTTGRDKCRFDACVSVVEAIQPKGEVGKKTLRGGRFAVFDHKGSCKTIEQTFDEIFLGWYPTSKEKLADAPCYCEHADFKKGIPEAESITKIYIPLED